MQPKPHKKNTIRFFIMRLIRIWDSIKTDGLAYFLRERIYINRKAMIIEKNLLETNNANRFLQNSNIKFKEITEDAIKNNKYLFPINNRYLKALYYLKKGYSGHVIVRGNEVIGDVWYSATSKDDKLPVHPDIARYGIKSSKDCAYSFDQFVSPGERGNKVAAALINGQACQLREKGYARVAGYCWADNHPAVWNTCVMNKFKKLTTVRIYRFIFLEKKFTNKQ